MSRKTIYSDSRLTLVKGVDHMLGNFCQIYDKELQNETPEGEGLVFDWTQANGIETNLTAYPNSLGRDAIVESYILENMDNAMDNETLLKLS